MRIVDIKLSLKLATNQRKKDKVDIPDMENSPEFVLNINKDLRKWCRENYHLFDQGNEIEDEPSIG